MDDVLPDAFKPTPVCEGLLVEGKRWGAQKQRGPARPQKAASMPAVCPSRWGCQHQLRHCELHCWAPGRSCWPPQIPGANFSRVWL
eukprot:131818-Pelagomonas_calceolata.AAC.7